MTIVLVSAILLPACWLGTFIPPGKDGLPFGSNNPPDGSAYGIIPANVSPGNIFDPESTTDFGNGPSGRAYVQYSATITLKNFTGSLSDISNATFFYGTGSEDLTTFSGSPGPGPGGQSVPEPSKLVAIFGLASMGLIGLAWRRRKQAA
jgi:hypothetical protein